jgi:3-isopropylmalate/(R)-2-methylmalate dehydratase small subunit
MFNCGLMAVALAPETIGRLFDEFAALPTVVSADLDTGLLRFEAQDRRRDIPFAVSPFDRALVEAGGWVEYADARY